MVGASAGKVNSPEVPIPNINREEKIEKPLKVLSPSSIKKILDDYIVGQEHAKKTLAVAVYNHYKRLVLQKGIEHFELEDTLHFSEKIPAELNDVEVEKSNILFVGPTGRYQYLLHCLV